MEQIEPILELSIDCEEWFQKQISRLNETNDANGAAVISELSHRFSTWCTSSGALADEKVCLDRRLRHHVEIQDQVLRVLDLMRANLAYVFELDDSFEQMGAELSPTQQHCLRMENVEAVSEGIERLYRIGILIRQSSMASQARRAREFSETFDLNSFENLAYLYLKTLYATASEGLLEQLTNSMSDTYKMFLYQKSKTQARPRQRLRRRLHLPTISEKPEDKEIEETMDVEVDTSKPSRDMIPNITRVQLPSHSAPTTMDSQEAKKRLRKLQNHSVKSRTASILVNQVDYPRPAEGSETCDWCFSPLPKDIFEGDNWQQHLNEDHRPFVCISEKCLNLSPSPRFAASRKWLEHMLRTHGAKWHREVHAPSQWACPLCNDAAAIFPNAGDLAAHLTNHKEITLADSQKHAIVRQSITRHPRANGVCPLCCLSIKGDQDYSPKKRSTLEGKGKRKATSMSTQQVGIGSSHKRIKRQTGRADLDPSVGAEDNIEPPSTTDLTPELIASHIAGHLRTIMLLTLRIIATDTALDKSTDEQSVAGDTDNQLSRISTRYDGRSEDNDYNAKLLRNESETPDSDYDPPPQDDIPDSEFTSWADLRSIQEDSPADDFLQRAVEEGAFQSHLGKTMLRTFRVRGIPLDWDATRLQSFFEQETPAGIIVKSLAREIDGRSETATIIFNESSLLPADRTRSILLPKQSKNKSAYNHFLELDDEFLGITTLYTPPLENHKVDVIAMPGFSRNAFESFRERGGDHMWLRDSLPYDITKEDTNTPMGRVMIYGYSPDVTQRKGQQYFEDFAASFRVSLLSVTASVPTIRPIIIVAHSLGGLIIKQTLILLSMSPNEDDRKLLRAIYGIVFFGVPRAGVHVSSLIPMVGTMSNRSFIESLRIDSHIPRTQHIEFQNAIGGKGESEVFSFFETDLSPTAQQDKHNNWVMTGPPAILVNKSSAVQSRPWEDDQEHISAIARTHSDMVKFGLRDHDYDNVRGKLLGLARRALKARNQVQSSNIKFLVPHTRNQKFVGRYQILGDLKREFGFSLHTDLEHSRRRISLYGLGGVGKSQIALAFAYQLQTSNPDVSIFWVRASSREEFFLAYCKIAQEYNIPGYDDTNVDLLSLVKRWLENEYQGRWFMVLDSADDTQLFFQSQSERDSTYASSDLGEGPLEIYIPTCTNGSILITTRNMQVGLKLAPQQLAIKVGMMVDDEAHQLLCTILGDDNISARETSKISSRLDYLPLALARAARYIHESGLSVGEYIQLSDGSDNNLVKLLIIPFWTEGRYVDEQNEVTGTFITVFKQIERLSKPASDILSLSSLFHCQAIPKTLIYNCWLRRWPILLEAMQAAEHQIRPKLSEAIQATEHFTLALETLEEFSLVTDNGDEAVDMIRLVQLSLHKWLACKGKMAEFAQLALEIVSESLSVGYPWANELCLRYLPHACVLLEVYGSTSEDDNIAKAHLLQRLARCFVYLQRWEEAEQRQIQAIELWERIHGKAHPETLTGISDLALIYRNQSRWKEAEGLEMQVMEKRARVLADEHPDTLATMSNLASIYQKQRQWKKAEGLEIQVMKTRRRVLGDEHPDTVASKSNLASIYQKQRQWKEAEELQMQVVETRRKLLGGEHPDALASASNLALIYKYQGRWEEAEELQMQVIEIRRKLLGDEHPDTLTSMSKLVLIYQNQRRWKDAEGLEMQVMEKRIKVLGEEHPDTLASMSNLATIYREQSRWDSADDLKRRVIRTRRKILEDEDPDTLASTSDGA